LNELNEEKNKFLGMAAHDLSSPIDYIQSLSQLMLDNNATDNYLEFVELINHVSKNSLNLIKNLLNISVIESNTIHLNIREYDYIDFLKKIIRIYQPLAKRKEIKILFECPLNILILAYDEVYMEQVVSNLITNAIKYSYVNSSIKVSMKKYDSKVLTEVMDQGVGIAENEIKKLFNFFQKTSSKPTSGELSSGLGLAIAKKMVNLHNGTIGVSSVLNQGSNFFLLLTLLIQPIIFLACHSV